MTGARATMDSRVSSWPTVIIDSCQALTTMPNSNRLLELLTRQTDEFCSRRLFAVNYEATSKRPFFGDIVV